MGKKRKQRSRTGGTSPGNNGGRGGQNRGGQPGGGGNRRRRRRPNDNGVKPADLPDVVSENGEPIPPEPGHGLLELHPNGYGFLASPENNYDRVRSDPFVPGTMIEKYRLREGVMIQGMVQHARKQQGPRLKEITSVDGMPPDDYAECQAV